MAGLRDRPRGGSRARILAATRTSPPADTGLSHWSSWEMAPFIVRTEGVYVSHRHVAMLWREAGLRPHRQGTFKISKDPDFHSTWPTVPVRLPRCRRPHLRTRL
ncbi:hypothetical protein [Pseudonocardia adelaidensis]|uniref:hypothetical protein n=1 Tax=Pseudonocardia adelaidensis TaxID=648754 RepID=UPI0031EEEBBC